MSLDSLICSGEHLKSNCSGAQVTKYPPYAVVPMKPVKKQAHHKLNTKKMLKPGTAATVGFGIVRYTQVT